MERCGRRSGSSGGIGPVYEVVDGGGGRGTPIQFFFHFHAVSDKNYAKQWTALVLRCFYVVTVKCTLHLDVTMMSSYVVALLDLGFYTSRGKSATEPRTPMIG